VKRQKKPNTRSRSVETVNLAARVAAWDTRAYSRSRLWKHDALCAEDKEKVARGFRVSGFRKYSCNEDFLPC
jgi:hypothetical protein